VAGVEVVALGVVVTVTVVVLVTVAVEVVALTAVRSTGSVVVEVRPVSLTSPVRQQLLLVALDNNNNNNKFTRAAIPLKFLIVINRTGTRNTSLWHRITV